MYRFALALFAVQAVPAFAAGSVVTDNTLGAVRTINGPNYPITQTYGQIVGGAGGNLFFSFGTFNIGTSETATFSSTTPVANVITRVTGSASSIDGQIASTIGGANFFLIDPLGISFGPNASLNISGSFHASTADYVKLGSNGRFDATTPANSVLTSAPPSAFGFLNANPAPVTVSGSTLQMPDGQTLSLFGGGVTLTNALQRAAGGQIDIAGVSAPGEVLPAAPGIGAAVAANSSLLTFSGSLLQTDSVPGLTAGNIFIRGGTLTMTNSALTSDHDQPGAGGNVELALSGMASLAGSAITARNLGAGSGGNLLLTAAGVALTGGSFLDTSVSGTGAGGNQTITSSAPVVISGTDISGNRSGLYAGSNGAGSAGTIAVTAPQLTIDTGGNIYSFATAGGNGAGINLNVGSAQFDSGGRVLTETYGSGRGGDIMLTATGSVAIAGNESASVLSGLSTATFGPGNSGNISVQANSISIADGAAVASASYAAGRSGDLVLTAAQSLNLSNGGTVSSVATTTGGAGAITLTAPQIGITDGIVDSTNYSSGTTGGILIQGADVTVAGPIRSTTWGAGAGADIDLRASSSLQVFGAALTGISSEADSIGNGGSITIATPLLVVDGAAILAITHDQGRAGNINVTTGTLRLLGDGQLSVSSYLGNGDGGNLNVNASDRIEITAGPTQLGGLDASTYFGGRGGAITVTTPLLTMNGGSIQSNTNFGADAGVISLSVGSLLMQGDSNIGASVLFGSSRGGSINIAASGSVSIMPTTNHFLPAIDTSTLINTQGDGGSITITAPVLAVAGRSIASNTNGTGNAGDVTLNAGRLALSAGGRIDTSTNWSGRGGTITVNAGDILLDGGSSISAKSTSSGLAGHIVLNAGNSLQLTGGSAITTESIRADGGNIDIHAGVLVSLQDSKITTTVGAGLGNGGNITIDPTFVVLQSSQIIANAFGGNGGNINITAGNIFESPGSVISASSQLGVSGTVSISSPIVDLTSNLVTLPTAYLDVSNLLAERCAARLAGKASSFVLAGRGGMPVEPAGLLPSSASMNSPAVAAADITNGSGNQSLLLAQNDFGCSK